MADPANRAGKIFSDLVRAGEIDLSKYEAQAAAMMAAFQSPLGQKLRKELQAALHEEQSRFEVAFGEPKPFALEDFIRWAMRVGWSAEYIRQGRWTPRDLMPYIEGYLLRLKDLNGEIGAADHTAHPALPIVSAKAPNPTIEYGGKTFIVTPDQADAFDAIVRQHPQPVGLGPVIGPQPKRRLKSLPKELQDLLHSSPKGYRLELPRPT